MTKKIFDLNIRVKSKDIVKEIYKITYNKNFDKDRGLRDQLRRSAVSIPSNIAEWYYRSSKNEFRRFLKISKGSCWELISQMIITDELWYLEYSLENIINELNHLAAMIGKLITSLK